MSPDKKIWSTVLSLALLGQSVCGVDISKPGSETASDSISTPTKKSETTDILFVQANCTKTGVSIPKPLGWTLLEIQITPTFVNCYISKQQITGEEDFRDGLRISKLHVSLFDQDKISYAKQLASQPDTGLLPQANTFRETRVGSFRIFSGRFINTRYNILLNEERKIIVPDGSGFIYILAFTAPKLTSDEDFRKYGRNMLGGILINGLPTK